MFEELEEEEKEKTQSRKKRLWIGACIIAALVVVIALVYVISGPRTKAPVRVQPRAPAGQTAAADALHDLRLVRAVMGKDVSGLRVLWSVQLRNRSAVYTYSDIQYEASYITVDGKLLSVVRDTIKDSIGPGEEKTIPQFVDGLYDARASTFQFLIQGAKATVAQ
jgi:hypothetical protein